MTLQPYRLHGEERDEIEALVLRIKRADDKVRQPAKKPAVPDADAAWAEANQLPRAFFEFFELQRVES